MRASAACKELRPVSGIPEEHLGAVAPIDNLRGFEVVGSVGDNAEQARRMSSSGLGTTNEGSDLPRHLQVGSGGLGERVDQPVGTPIDSSEARAVAFLSLSLYIYIY